MTCDNELPRITRHRINCQAMVKDTRCNNPAQIEIAVQQKRTEGKLRLVAFLCSGCAIRDTKGFDQGEYSFLLGLEEIEARRREAKKGFRQLSKVIKSKGKLATEAQTND